MILLVNGGWSAWTSWSTCTVTCDGGTTTKTRSCDNPEPENGGDDCEGDTYKTIDCNTIACAGKLYHS